jgi:hypothetical protein
MQQDAPHKDKVCTEVVRCLMRAVIFIKQPVHFGESNSEMFPFGEDVMLPSKFPI